jgi:hypothetical protein
MNRSSRCVAVVSLIGLLVPAFAFAQRSWDGGNGTFVWGENGNWDPDGSPNGEPIAVGNLATAFNDTTLVDAAYTIDSLLIIGGADVINSPDNGTTAFELQVTGLTILGGANSSMTIFGGAPDGLDTGTLTVDADASLFLNSQRPAGTAVVEVDSGALVINTGGTLLGNGRIDLVQSLTGFGVLFENNGTLAAGALGLFANPPATTLQITATDPDATIELDGSANPSTSIVNVNRNATLDIDVPLTNAFGSELNLSAGATLDIADDWQASGAQINVNTPGVVIGTAGPAARIVGGELSIFNSTVLTLDDGFDSLVVDTVLQTSDAVVNNSGTITFNDFAHFTSAADFNMVGSAAKLIVNRSVVIDDPNFNLDGAGAAGNVTTINDLGILDLNLGAGADENFAHTININGGQLDVTSSDGDWSLNGNGTINAGGVADSSIEGDTFQLTGTGGINVATNATLDVNATTEITGTPAINIEEGGELNFATVTYGNSGATYTGEGVLRKGLATIAANTTWNVATVDLDDGDTTINARLTINADSLELSSPGGVDRTHTINNSGSLFVFGIDDGWELAQGGVIVYNGDAMSAIYLSGSDILVNGTINHNGDGRSEAQIIIGATGVVNILTAANQFRLGGGNAVDTNRILGGTINGPGLLGCQAPSSLHGFGTINTGIDFDETSNLMAEGGMLTVNGAIVDVNLIGTAGDSDILNITTAWNTNTTASVNLLGGELRGAAITNNGPEGINGRGLLSARINNNSRIDADGGGTLVVDTAADDNDWDGTLNTGALRAISGNLEVRDNSAFPFQGSVQVNSGRELFANGFELDFEPASTLTLNAGTYRTSGNNHFGGAINVGPETAEIAAAGTAIFEATSVTIFAGTLRLNSPVTQIDPGATFAGAGSLLNTEGNFLRLQDGADVDVRVRNPGDLIIGCRVPRRPRDSTTNKTQPERGLSISVAWHSVSSIAIR